MIHTWEYQDNFEFRFVQYGLTDALDEKIAHLVAYLGIAQ